MAGRVAATAAAMLSAALTMGVGPAYAAPSDGPTVEFTGGSVMSMLVCKSEPSTGRLNVDEQTRVMFVNRLGQPADLLVDGQSTKAVGPNQAVPVVFHHGPVEVSMAFDCSAGLVEEFRSVAVAVTAAPPAPAKAAPRTTPPQPAAAPIPRGTGGGQSPTRTSAPRSSTTEGTTTTPPAQATVPPAEAVPGGSAAAGDPLVTPSSAVPPAIAVEPVIPASGPPRNGPAGLLALIATVCVVGVGMAAIRAIIAQRTTRASFA